MDRRHLLKGAAAAALVGPSCADAYRRRNARVVIVGAGIIGVSVAYHLASGGARVTVLDRGVPGAAGTQGAFAMLIATHETGAKSLNDLYGAAVQDWRRLELELPGAFDIQWGGTLTWAAPGAAAEALRQRYARALAYGAPVRALARDDFAALVPGVEPGPFGAGMFSPEQGTLDPSQAHAALLRAAARRGVEFHSACEVLAFQRADAPITGVTTTKGTFAADVIVLCAGVDAPKLAAMAGANVPIAAVSGALAHSKPFRRVLARVLNGPRGSIKQDPDGRIVTGLDYAPHASAAEPTAAYGRELLAKAATVVPALKGAALERMTIGTVPIPIDNMPVIGFVDAAPALYVVSTMSGITLAPILGRFAATEILAGLSLQGLEEWRPARFG